MRALLKTGLSLLLLAFVLIGVSYVTLRAHGVNNTLPAEGRKPATETRPVTAAVTAVELSGPIELTLRYGPQPSLEVRGEQRLLGNINTTQDGATLHIGTRGILLSHHHPLQAVLTLPSLSSIAVDGSSDTTVDGFSGERIDLRLSGSGSIKFNGRYRQVGARLQGSGDMDLDVGNCHNVKAELVGSGGLTLAGASQELDTEATGSGTLDARHLRADTATVRQFGSGSSTVTASRAVTVSLSGTGDVEVHGRPLQRSVNRTGNGDVSFAE